VPGRTARAARITKVGGGGRAALPTDAADARAAGDEAAGLLGALDVREDALQLRRVAQRALLRGGLQRVAHLELLGERHHLLEQRVVDGRVHEPARARAAALAHHRGEAPGAQPHRQGPAATRV
jgi:hypothetical protein